MKNNLLTKLTGFFAVIAGSIPFILIIAQASTENYIRLVSSDMNGTSGESSSNRPAISADGRYVVFESDSSNLVEDDTNGSTDIFRKEVLTGKIERVSVDALGVEGDNESAAPSISSNGRYVAFESLATNLVGTSDTNDQRDVFRKDMVTKQIVRASTSQSGNQVIEASSSPAISGDGRYIAFESDSGDLVPNDNNSRVDIFRKDLINNSTVGAILKVSTGINGAEADSDSSEATISSDGRYIAFQSWASNLVAADEGWNQLHVFRKDMSGGSMVRVSAAASGVEANDRSEEPSISSNGRYVAFTSKASNLVVSDDNEMADIFRKDLSGGGEVVRASTSLQAEETTSDSGGASVSTDGRYVSFHSLADNLTADDNDQTTDVFRKDLQTGYIVSVSNDSNGVSGNDDSSSAIMSANGAFISFVSNATNLVQDISNLYSTYFVDMNYSPFLRDTTIPNLSITAPANEKHIRRTLSIKSNASDPAVLNQNVSGLREVGFFQGSTLLKTTSYSVYTNNIDTTKMTNGRKVFTIVARDKAGNTKQLQRAYTIDNVNPAVPSAYILPSSPVNGAYAKAHYKVSDKLSPKVYVTLQISTLGGKVVKSYAVGAKLKGIVHKKSIQMPGTAGTYLYKVIAKDYAGNQLIRTVKFILK